MNSPVLSNSQETLLPSPLTLVFWLKSQGFSFPALLCQNTHPHPHTRTHILRDRGMETETDRQRLGVGGWRGSIRDFPPMLLGPRFCGGREGLPSQSPRHLSACHCLSPLLSLDSWGLGQERMGKTNRNRAFPLSDLEGLSFPFLRPEIEGSFCRYVWFVCCAQFWLHGVSEPGLEIAEERKWISHH